MATLERAVMVMAVAASLQAVTLIYVGYRVHDLSQAAKAWQKESKLVLIKAGSVPTPLPVPVKR